MSNKLTKEEVRKDILSMKSRLKQALPEGFDINRFSQIATTEVNCSEKLPLCDKLSVYGSIMIATQLGLEVGSALGQSYLVPYKNKGQYRCQFIIGYRGMIELARRSGQIQSISSHEVYENDLFEFEYGINETLRHIPTEGDKGRFRAVYAIARLRDGGHQIEVMFKNDIDAIKKCSQGAYSEYSPWNKYYAEMAKKTSIRRIFKYLPVSVNLQKAGKVDEEGELGVQENEFFEETKELENKENDQESKLDQIAQQVKTESS